MTAVKLSALVIAALAIVPNTARADAFDLSCTSLDAQGQPQGDARRFHIDREAARWCGGICDPANTITGDDGKLLTFGGLPATAGLASRMTYDIGGRILLTELTISGNKLTTRSLCEVEPFSGFTSDFSASPRPENMRALQAVPPLIGTDGRPIAGRVAVELVVDERGRITGCSTRTSSGNSDLDRYACQQVSERLTMKPAADSTGKPVAGRFRTTIAFSEVG